MSRRRSTRASRTSSPTIENIEELVQAAAPSSSTSALNADADADDELADALIDPTTNTPSQPLVNPAYLGHRLARFAFGQEESYHRYAAAFAAAFVLGTAVRTACFTPNLPIFGKYLESNFAPVERSDVSWAWIAALRLLDIFVALGVWEGAGRVVDGPYLGVLLAGISRSPLYFLLHEHYLLSSKTLSIIFLTDAATLATITFVISELLPYPSPSHPLSLAHRQPLHALLRLFNKQNAVPLLSALISASTLSALASFIVSHTYLPDLLRRQTLQSIIPSHSNLVHTQLSGSEALAHPSILVPTLRYSTLLGTTRDAPSMPLQLLISSLTPFLYAILVTAILPRAEPARIGTIAAIASGVVAVITMWNVLPVTLTGAVGVGAEVATREGITAALVAWILEDVRRPLRKIEVERSVDEDGTETTVIRADLQPEEE